jgi:hypothetical protein
MAADALTNSPPSPVGINTNQQQCAVSVPALKSQSMAADQRTQSADITTLEALLKGDNFEKQCQAAKQLVKLGNEGQLIAMPFLERALLDIRAVDPKVSLEAGTLLAQCISNNPSQTTITIEKLNAYAQRLTRYGEQRFFASRPRRAEEETAQESEERRRESRSLSSRMKAMREQLVTVYHALCKDEKN